MILRNFIFFTWMLLFFTVCNVFAEVKYIERGTAETIFTKIIMLEGELFLTGGVDPLLVAGFNENVPIFKPFLKYDEKDSKGFLYIAQEHFPSIGEMVKRKPVNQWDLRLNNNLSIEFDMQLNHTNGYVDFRKINLQRLHLEFNEGEIVINLTRSIDESVLSAIVMQGGNIKILLSKHNAVFVDAKHFLGELEKKEFHGEDGVFVNEAYDQQDHYYFLRLKGKSGKIVLEMVE